MIEVTRTGDGDPMTFEVSVRDGAGETLHRVRMSKADHKRLGGGAGPEDAVRAAFAFLLDREPKEAILGAFEINVIGRYFPEFEDRLPDYLAKL